MIEATKLPLFFTAAVLLAIAPGPGMLYVLSRSLAGGQREGTFSALGTLVGGMAHVFAAAAGVSVILAKSALAFATVKYAGAGYLCYLGIKMIRDARRNGELPEFPRPASRSPFWQGVATEILNPKTALFFLSFIPQFVGHASHHVFWMFVALGSVSVALNTSSDLIIIRLAEPLGDWIRTSAKFRRRQRTATGVIMMGLGAYLAISESHN